MPDPDKTPPASPSPESKPQTKPNKSPGILRADFDKAVRFGGVLGKCAYSTQTIALFRKPDGRPVEGDYDGVQMKAVALGIQIDAAKAKKCPDGADPVVVPWSNVTSFVPGE